MIAALLAACLALGACAGERHATPLLGQWVWTARDAALLRSALTRRADMQAGVWLATVTRRGDSLVATLGLPVDTGGAVRNWAVIRLEDSFAALWETESAETVAASLATRLRPILRLADAGSVGARPVQIDFDAPVRRLEAYADLLARLRRDVLADRTVWITSVVAHVSEPAYGALFGRVVDGHVVQLFDTGDTYSYDPARARRLRRWLDAAGMAYAIGVASFERRLTGGRETTHRAWFDALPHLSASSLYGGTWVFPGGMPYEHLLAGDRCAGCSCAAC